MALGAYIRPVLTARMIAKPAAAAVLRRNHLNLGPSIPVNLGPGRRARTWRLYEAPEETIGA